jgi:hypothetical protein
VRTTRIGKGRRWTGAADGGRQTLGEHRRSREKNDGDRLGRLRWNRSLPCLFRNQATIGQILVMGVVAPIGGRAMRFEDALTVPLLQGLRCSSDQLSKFSRAIWTLRGYVIAHEEDTFVNCYLLPRVCDFWFGLVTTNVHTLHLTILMFYEYKNGVRRAYHLTLSKRRRK